MLSRKGPGRPFCYLQYLTLTKIMRKSWEKDRKISQIFSKWEYFCQNWRITLGTIFCLFLTIFVSAVYRRIEQVLCMEVCIHVGFLIGLMHLDIFLGEYPYYSPSLVLISFLKVGIPPLEIRTRQVVFLGLFPRFFFMHRAYI